MQKIYDLLDAPLEVETLPAQLLDIEAFAAKASREHRKAENKLLELRGQAYNPQLKTDLERKVDVDYKTREHRQVAEQWGDLVQLISQRIELGKALLRHDNE